MLSDTPGSSVPANSVVTRIVTVRGAELACALVPSTITSTKDKSVAVTAAAGRKRFLDETCQRWPTWLSRKRSMRAALYG